MAQPLSSAGETYSDYGVPGEKSSFSFTVADITAGNYAAISAALTTLWGSIDALLLGNIAARRVTAQSTEPDVSPVSNPEAQRENKWLVRYHDTSARKFTLELPTANLSLLDTNTEFLDMTGTEAANFKTDFEAVAKSPADASAVTVDSIQFVGRRS